MTDAELDTLMTCFAPGAPLCQGRTAADGRVRDAEVGLVLEGSITASKPLADGSTVVISHMGPGGVFADVCRCAAAARSM